MAASRDSLNPPDWRDVMDTLLAFQEQNHISVALGIKTEVRNGRPDLCMSVEGYASETEGTGPKRLVLSRCHLGSQSFKTMEAAILFLLYGIDYQLAEGEMGGYDNP